jgi:hypothetical protein
VRSAVAQGQYEYPRGLFFGGHEASTVRRILDENLPRWMSEARSVLHVDFHTGLGAWGTYKLLLDPEMDPARVGWVRSVFGDERVEHVDPEGISYPTRGDIGAWCRATFPGRVYDAVCAEFGTYSGLRVVSALRAENQAHHWLEPGAPEVLRAKASLKEAFVPADPSWRAGTVAQALELLGRASGVTFGR